jgi:hypothetical protein
MVMSVKKAKEQCGYEEKPVRASCSNCKAFASDMEYPSWCKTQAERSEFDSKGYAKLEKNMRCIDHGFAVKKLGLCRLWGPKVAAV